jgi:hypothetical protein
MSFSRIAKESRKKRVRGRELIGNVVGSNSTTPVVSTYYLNPGLSDSFPRLSQEADVWEQYKLHQCSVRYVPAVGSTTQGSIVLSPDYDPTDSPPTTEQELANTEGSKEGFPWSPFQIDLDPKAMNALGPRKFIRDGNVAGDRKNFDSCMLSVAAIDNGGTGTMGKLWIEYDIEFFVPQLQATTLLPTKAAAFNLSANQAFTSGDDATVVFDEVIANGLGATLASGVVTLPKGVYFVMAEITGAYDNATTIHTSTIVIQKNSGNISPPLRSEVKGVQTSGIAIDHLSASGIVSSDGTDEFLVNADFLGDDGDFLVDKCRLLFISV